MTSRTPVAPRLIVAALTALATPAWAQEAPPMVGGTTTSDYEQVGVLVACTSDGCWDFCSGTLIDDTWVLTAAHCVAAMDEAVRYYRATPYFGVGPTVDSLTDYQEVVQYIEHPSYSERTLANDIGLLELAGTLSGIDPMPLRDESPSSIGSDTFRYVGYGVTRDDRSDSGTKRYGDIPLDSYDDQFIYAYDSSGRTNVCFGDSGGAGLEPVSGGYLLGAVNSFVAPGCAGGYTGGTRVDIYIDWIASYSSTSSGGSTGGGTDGGGSTGGGSSGGGSTGGGSTGGGSSGGGGTDGGSADGGSADGSGDGTGTGDEGGTGDGETAEAPEVTVGDAEAQEYDDASKGSGGCSTAPRSGGLSLGLLAFVGALGLLRRREA
jgi:hypothetical protein